MTHAQKTQYSKLLSKVAETYKAMHENTDRTKQDALAQKWVNATIKADNFMMKYL